MNKISLGKDIKLLDLGHLYQISGLVFSGQGRSFVTTLPHKHDDLYEPIENLELDEEGMNGLLNQLDVLDIEVDPILKKIVRKSQRQIEGTAQWAVYKRDNYTCRYCGRDGIPMSIDHVDLWENGGAPIIENFVCACKKCNRERGNMEYDVWLKSPSYARLSINLPEEVKRQNLALALDLPRLRTLRLQNPWSR